jgi:hypothetical protein
VSAFNNKIKGFFMSVRIEQLCLVAALIMFPVFLSAQETVVTPEMLQSDPVYSPFVGRDFPDQVLFGDTHFHTELSFDAGMIGTRLDVDDAYRFARGETVISNTGQPVQLIRPLDFLVITDHAEFIGLAPQIRTSAPELLSDPWGRRMYDLFNSGEEGRMKAFLEIIEVSTTPPFDNPMSSNDAAWSIWREIVHEADQYNEPGHFSAMTGYEWTSTPKGDNLHRVVILADGAEKTSQTLPYSMFDSADPEDLWQYLSEYEASTGGQAIAVPHNGNLSNGIMFGERMSNGRRMTREYAEMRLRYEPLHEMSQMKGDEETHPLLSPEDEFADFENWDVGNIAGNRPKEESMLQYEYARSALKIGLKLGDQIGINPYKHGLIAATDTHTGLATSREENYFGKYQHTEPSPTRHNGEVVPAEDPNLRILTSQEGASGLTAVWARNNTRGDIFDSMRRKEVYATTGTRIRVRVFGGWNFVPSDVLASDFARTGYSGGAPMGGDLLNPPAGAAPSFIIRAVKDPDGANLDRVQVIKGWLDEDGETHERIYDVAVSDEREIGDDGRAREPVGTTVDIENATYTNSIGDAILAGYWEDPDFDSAEAAFYYVRVIEIPTPRWTTHDAAFFDIPLPDRVPPVVQDRAYTSPIWYTP